MRHTYKGFYIVYEPKPIPDRRYDYDWTHEDYNGPGDNRAGTAASVSVCMAEIDMLLDGDE